MSTIKYTIRLPRTGKKHHSDRIGAKHNLWEFMNEIKHDIYEWPGTEIELSEQLITTSFTILLPHFSAIEIEKELRNIFITIQKPVPNEFTSLFSDLFASHISAKLKLNR